MMGGGRWGGAGGLASEDRYDSLAPDVSVASVAGEDCEGGEECLCSAFEVWSNSTFKLSGWMASRTLASREAARSCVCIHEKSNLKINTLYGFSANLKFCNLIFSHTKNRAVAGIVMNCNNKNANLKDTPLFNSISLLYVLFFSRKDTFSQVLRRMTRSYCPFLRFKEMSMDCRFEVGSWIMAWYHGALLTTHYLLLHLLTDALARLASSNNKVPKHASSLPSFTLCPSARHQPHDTGHDALASRDTGHHTQTSASICILSCRASPTGHHTQGITHRASPTNICLLPHVKQNSGCASDIRAASHTLPPRVCIRGRT